MDEGYEVVEYRNCDCGHDMCPGERETVLFQHKDKPQCINYMKRFPEQINCTTDIFIFNNDKDKINIRVHLLSGLIATRKLRVQKIHEEGRQWMMNLL